MSTDSRYRDKLRDQNALSEEIVNAITQNTLGEAVDDAELEDELELLQQEQLDEQMLNTNPPVTDTAQKLPSVKERTFSSLLIEAGQD